MTTSNPQNDFKVKFDGQLHQVDANTLINSLINLSTIIQELNVVSDPNRKIEIKIKATEKGSFWIHLSLIAEKIPDLFDQENIQTTAAIATISGISIIKSVAYLFQLKKHLSGKKPKTIQESNKGGVIKIENERGDIIFMDSVIFNIYNTNQPVQDSISNTFDTLQNDSSISGFEIADAEKRPLFEINRTDFGEMSIKNEVVEENKKIFTEIANLHIFKIVFEDKYKWEFYYKGNKISAHIADINFFKSIDEGERFSKGDTLKSELEITQIFDNTVNTYINHSYKIKNVLEHIPRGKQQKLNFKGEI